MPRDENPRPKPDWTLVDLVVMGKEGLPPFQSSELSEDNLDGRFCTESQELLQPKQAAAARIPRSAKSITRLRNRERFLIKVVRTFSPKEMRDLEFQPVIPVLTEMLSQPEGAIAAKRISMCGPSAVLVLIAACQSANATERFNASASVGWPKDARHVELMLRLLDDASPQARFNALSGAEFNRRRASLNLCARDSETKTCRCVGTPPSTCGVAICGTRPKSILTS